jgi:hypothetical protein
MISAAPVQRRLPIIVEIVPPLASIEAARKDLRTDEDEIMYLIQDGQMLAFDLRTPGADKAFVRIWPASIDAIMAARKTGTQVRRIKDEELPSIISKIISIDRSHVRAVILRNRLVTSSTHIHNLIRPGLLEAVPGTGDTINQTPLLIRTSIVAFLKQRRMS